jgi:hypothetical protein
MTPTDRSTDIQQRIPETNWPDGTPVSAWSKATGTMPGKRAPENYRPSWTLDSRRER